MMTFRLVVLAGTAFAVISMLLPFVTFPVVGPVDGIAADAWPALLPLVVVAVLSLTGRWGTGLGAGAGVAAVTTAGLSLVFSVIKVTDAVLAVRATDGATLGPGSMVLAGAALVVTAAAAVGVLSRR